MATQPFSPGWPAPAAWALRARRPSALPAKLCLWLLAAAALQPQRTLALPGAADAPAAVAARAVPEVVLETRRLPVENLVDRKVYNLNGDIRSAFGTVSDILVAIPSVEVGIDGSISLRGDSSVLILVDEQPLTQVSGPFVAEALRQIPAEDIEKIEVITNPPAQYKAEGAAGIINIVTRKGRREGVTGTANASAGNAHRATAGINARYGSGPLGLFGGLSLREDNRPSRSTSDRSVPQLASGDPILSHSQFTQDPRRLMPYVRAGLNYDFNDLQSVRAYVSRGGRTGSTPSTNFSQSGAAAGPPDSITERDSSDRQWSMDSDQRITFEQKMAKEDEQLTVSLHRGVYHNRDTYAYTDLPILPAAQPAYSHSLQIQDYLSTGFNADYTLPIAKDESLRAGASVQKDDRAYANSGDTVDPASGAILLSPQLANDFLYRQQVDAAYLSFQNTLLGWNALVGMRLERTRTHAEQRTQHQLTLRRYAQLFPSLHLERDLPADATLTFSVTRRIARPDPGSLNPYVDQSDPQNLRSGNPYLLPQLARAYEAGYSIELAQIVYNLTGYLRRNFNTVTDVAQAVAADVVLITRTNLPQSNAAGLEFSANGRLLPKLRFGLSGNLFHNQIDSLALGPALQSTTGINAKVNLDFRASVSDTLQVSMTHSARRLTPQGSLGASNQLNAGYKRQIHYNLLAVATLTDVLNGQVARRVTQTSTFSDITQQRLQGRAVSFGLIYNFGWRKARKAVTEDEN